MKKALIVINMQNDFCSGGSLEITNDNKIIPIINNLLTKFDLVIFSKDWHNPKMLAFESMQSKFEKGAYDKYVTKEGKECVIWPDHCIENTPGADIHSDIKFENCKDKFYIFKKGNDPEHHTYSAFEEIDEEGKNELDIFLKERNIKEVYVCGIGGDYCVKETAIDAVRLSYRTYFITNACEFIESKKLSTYFILTNVGVKLINSKEIII